MSKIFPLLCLVCLFFHIPPSLAQSDWTCDGGPNDVLAAAITAFENSDLETAADLALLAQEICLEAGNTNRYVQATNLIPRILLAQGTNPAVRTLNLSNLPEIITTNAEQLTLLVSLSAHPSGDIAWSPDGGLLAVSSGWDGVLVYITSGVMELGPADRLFEPFTHFVESLAFNSDGSRLALGTALGEVFIWDMTNRAQAFELEGHTPGPDIYCLAFSPDGKILASGSRDGVILIWDIATGTKITALEGHEDAVNTLAFSPDGTRLVSGSDDSTVRVWDTQMWDNLSSVEMETWIRSAAFSPDGTLLAFSDVNGQVSLWNKEVDTQLQTFSHPDAVLDVAFSPDGSLLATAGRDGLVRLWDIEKGAVITTRSHTDVGFIFSLTFNPVGTLLASSGDDLSVNLWGIKQ
ncbi:MAG: WD40 repeat domain-containing protein [Anaerolineae bacterium]|nr:WD40 repeat domain-containing protein [Anaerolineae bacterium]